METQSQGQVEKTIQGGPSLIRKESMSRDRNMAGIPVKKCASVHCRAWPTFVLWKHSSEGGPLGEARFPLTAVYDETFSYLGLCEAGESTAVYKE